MGAWPERSSGDCVVSFPRLCMMEETTTMRPPERSRSGSRSHVRATWPRWFAQSCRCAESGPFGPINPALLTRKSTRVVALRISFTAELTESRSSRSSLTTRGAGPFPRATRRLAASSAFTRFRHARSTVAPFARKPAAVANPKPLLAPVTTATWPSSVVASSSVQPLIRDDSPGWCQGDPLQNQRMPVATHLGYS